MSRARRTHSSALQLFPFLAVLVSALGALVLLLLAINRQVSLQSNAAAAQALIDQTTAEETALADQKRELEHHLRSLRTQVNQVRGEQQAVDQSLIARDQLVRTDLANSQAMRGELDRLRKSRVETEQSIADLRRKIAAVTAAKDRLARTRQNSDRTFVPVVHPGSNGTTRQPIYLECTDRGIVFQPQDIVVPNWLLKTEQGQAMLAHAIQSLAAHYVARGTGRGSNGPNGEVEPYPLLLVRPAGAWVFYAARQALEGLNVAYGYELVEADWAFQFPDLDPDSRALLAQCLELSRDNYAAADGSRSRQFGGSDVPDGGSGRGALTPNLGRLLGLEPVGDRGPGGRGGYPNPQRHGSTGGFAPGTSTNESGQSEAEGGSSGSVVPRGLTRGGPPNDGATVAGAEYQSPNPAGSAGNMSRGAASMSPQDANTGSADPNQHRELPDAITSNRSSLLDQPVPGDSDGKTDDLNSKISASPSVQPSGVGTPRRIRPADDETDAIDEMGSLSLPSNGKVPIARKIEIDCRAGSLHIGNRSVYFGTPSSPSLRSGMAAIVQEMQKEMATWGPAGMTFRWEPKLLCVVHADGLGTYYGLRAALIGSSIEIDHVIALEDGMDLNGTLFLAGLDRAQ